MLESQLKVLKQGCQWYIFLSLTPCWNLILEHLVFHNILLDINIFININKISSLFFTLKSKLSFETEISECRFSLDSLAIWCSDLHTLCTIGPFPVNPGSPHAENNCIQLRVFEFLDRPRASCFFRILNCKITPEGSYCLLISSQVHQVLRHRKGSFQEQSAQGCLCPLTPEDAEVTWGDWAPWALQKWRHQQQDLNGPL